MRLMRKESSAQRPATGPSMVGVDLTAPTKHRQTHFVSSSRDRTVNTECTHKIQLSVFSSRTSVLTLQRRGTRRHSLQFMSLQAFFSSPFYSA